MKLMMHSFDFGECLLTFRVPQDVMWNNRFGNVPDGVEVDMAAITDNAALGIKELAAIAANSESKPCCKATFALVLEYTLGKVEKCPVCGTKM